jgi:methylenetetrahydrofolate dehydrogenase (NADP+)/methenyltetrahydrofolate cyclohydrolase
MAGASIIDGKAAAARVRADVAARVAERVAQGRPAPGLAVVLVGEDPASQVYVRNKARATREVGMASIEHKLPVSTGEADLLALIAELNGRPEVNGILVQLPLPKHIDQGKVIEAIDPAKDVDGFHPVNVGRLAAGGKALAPCTPTGCLILAQSASSASRWRSSCWAPTAQ